MCSLILVFVQALGSNTNTGCCDCQHWGQMAEWGGFRQRLHQHQQQQQQADGGESSTGRTRGESSTGRTRKADQSDESRLGALLLERWAWGGMSLPMLQRLAAAGIDDGLHQPLLRHCIQKLPLKFPLWGTLFDYIGTLLVHFWKKNCTTNIHFWYTFGTFLVHFLEKCPTNVHFWYTFGTLFHKNVP